MNENKSPEKENLLIKEEVPVTVMTPTSPLQRLSFEQETSNDSKASVNTGI